MFQGPKTRTFPKGLTHTFGKKNAIFLNFLFSVKITLEIRFHNVLDRKKIITNNENNLSKSQTSYFSNRVNPWFGQKMQFFALFVFGQNKTRKKI